MLFYVRFCVCIVVALLTESLLLAHHAEPISTEFALPFEPGAGNQKVGYEYERQSAGVTAHTIPDLELEVGLGQRWQVNTSFPLVRTKEGPEEPSILAGGKLELGMRYLLLGGAKDNYAVSFQGTVEAPTGNRRLFGNTPELSPGLFIDRYVGQRLRLHSNLSWRTTVGRADDPERVFEYRHALVWFAAKRWIPVVEFLGATSTRDGETEFGVQPEIIFDVSPHVELKVGTPLGVTSHTPRIGVRAQCAFLWGR
jgi:hypothetical protein